MPSNQYIHNKVNDRVGFEQEMIKVRLIDKKLPSQTDGREQEAPDI